MACATIIRCGGSASTTTNVHSGSSKRTHRVIASWSVWPISRCSSADALNSLCHVSWLSTPTAIWYPLKYLPCFFLCSLPGDNRTPVCDSRQIACYDRVAIDWRKPSQFDDGSSLISPCNCLPGCTDISYVADVHHTHFFDLTKEHLL